MMGIGILPVEKLQTREDLNPNPAALEAGMLPLHHKSIPPEGATF